VKKPIGQPAGEGGGEATARRGKTRRPRNQTPNVAANRAV